MRKFFTVSSNITQGKIVIQDKSEIHHIKDVLRFAKGKQVSISDDKGNEYRAQIESVSMENITLSIKQKFASKGLSKTRITIACAIPKKAKMDDIIDKLAQLGVERIIPLKTSRVIVQVDKNKENLRLARWQKIALNASKQSQRSSVPVIDKIKSLKEVLDDSEKFELKLIPTLISERKSLREALGNHGYRSVLVLIGPEGDFTEQEVNLAIKSGFIPVTLGELVLRVDTAAIAVAALLRFYEND